MSRAEKLIERFLKIPRDFTWGELAIVLEECGYVMLKPGKTGGSRRKFTDSYNNIISLHKPHPGNIVKRYALKQIIDHLKEKGKISHE